MNLKPLTKQRFIITVNGLAVDVLFDLCTGIGFERSVTDYNDGSTGQTKQVAGFIKNSDITLGKVADEETDAGLRGWLSDQQKNSFPAFDLSIQAVAVDKKGTPINNYVPIKITQAQIKQVKYPDVDRASGDLAKWEIIIFVNGDVG